MATFYPTHMSLYSPFAIYVAKEISKKRRIVNKLKGNAGEPLSPPPYGYMEDPDNPKRWIVDEEAARVVRRIYKMMLNGQGCQRKSQRNSNVTAS